MIPGVLSNTQRQDQMAKAVKRFPMLDRRLYVSSPNRLTLICYGPSLRETWHQIRWLDQSKMTVSGAHDFCVEHDIIPTWHVDIDPREHKPKMLRNPRPETKYLMASCCHPDFWDVLKGYDVQLWHLINGDDNETMSWVHRHHPEGINSCIGGGSTVGQRAMNVAAVLGFRKFDVFGMDCSFGDRQHAAKHENPSLRVQRVLYCGKHYMTSPQLLQAAFEMKGFLEGTSDADVHFYGEGLMQAMARNIRRPHERITDSGELGKSNG